jgi:hypothetical protein
MAPSGRQVLGCNVILGGLTNRQRTAALGGKRTFAEYDRSTSENANGGTKGSYRRLVKSRKISSGVPDLALGCPSCRCCLSCPSSCDDRHCHCQALTYWRQAECQPAVLQPARFARHDRVRGCVRRFLPEDCSRALVRLPARSVAEASDCSHHHLARHDRVRGCVRRSLPED